MFFSQDRADVVSIVNKLCRKMPNPTQHIFAKLKRFVKNLQRETEIGRRSDDIFRFRMGRLRRNSKIIKRRRATARQSHLESIHTQAKYHCKKQRRSRAACCSIGSVRVNRICVVVERSGLRIGH